MAPRLGQHTDDEYEQGPATSEDTNEVAQNKEITEVSGPAEADQSADGGQG